MDAEKLLGQKISPETKVIEHRADEAIEGRSSE
jgi:hypothetical protein